MYQSWRRVHGRTQMSGAGFVVSAGGGGGPITLINTANAEDDTGTSMATLNSGAFSATTGNLVFVAVRAGLGGGTITVTDTAGNTYTQIETATGNAAAGFTTFYAKNITGNASNVITAHFSTNGQYTSLVVAQYSGLSTTAPLDAHRNDIFDTAVNTATTGAFTTTSANEVLVIAGCRASSSVMSAGTGYTLEVESTGTTAGHTGMEDKIVSAIQTGVTADMNSSSAETWIVAVATFTQ